MAQVDEQIIYQALFGYADGHRLLEASIRLSSRDLYDLSAVSDLANGVQLRPDESYLTGTALQDSRYFALIRTWPAAEMPRPGCVWSHVLFLTPEVLATQRDLGALDGLFARPHSADESGHYTRALDLRAGSSKSDVSPDLIALVLRSYYEGGRCPGSLPVGPALDDAVFAVWSQQWPRLRASFSFRTAPAATSSNRGSARFDFQPGLHRDAAKELVTVVSKDGFDVEWIDAAVADAVSQEVTPLRRFLWRYGKDVRLPRQRFQNLVKIHLATTRLPPADDLPLSWAKEIASLFSGAENAATLKRDMLGLEPAPLALCPAVSHGGTLELLAVLLRDGAVISDKSLEARLSEAPAAAVPALAASLGNHSLELGEQTATILAVLTRIADDRAVTDTRVPAAVRLTILRGRHDLISAASLAAIGDDDLLRLLDAIGGHSERTLILDALLQRDSVVYPDALLQHHAGELLLRAIAARSRGTLSNGATTILRTRTEELISFGALASIAGSAMAAQAADLLNFPIDDGMASDVRTWLSVLERPGSDAEGQARINFEAYMCIIAIRSELPAAWDLLSRTISGLRAAVLTEKLLNPAYDLLERQLPPNGWNSWDLDKRILIGLRQLRRRTGADEPIVARLHLSDEDLEFVFDDAPRKSSDPPRRAKLVTEVSRSSGLGTGHRASVVCRF